MSQRDAKTKLRYRHFARLQHSREPQSAQRS